MFTHFIGTIDPKGLWPLRAFAVTENTKTRAIVEKIPLPLVHCDEVQATLDELKIKNKAGETLKFQECIDFPPGTLIGEDRKTGIKKSVQI